MFVTNSINQVLVLINSQNDGVRRKTAVQEITRCLETWLFITVLPLPRANHEPSYMTVLCATFAFQTDVSVS